MRKKKGKAQDQAERGKTREKKQCDKRDQECKIASLQERDGEGERESTLKIHTPCDQLRKSPQGQIT